MKADQLRDKKDAELAEELVELQREQFTLRMQAGTGQLDAATQLRSARRNVARIKTIQRERELGTQAAKQDHQV